MISPEPPNDAGQIFRKHTLFLSGTGQRKQLPGIVLGTGMEGRAVSQVEELLQKGAQVGAPSGPPGRDLP